MTTYEVHIQENGKAFSFDTEEKADRKIAQLVSIGYHGVKSQYEAEWTAERARQELPKVQCQFNGEIFECRSSGRQCEKAVVWAEKKPSLAAEFGWEEIARAVNRKEVLIPSVILNFSLKKKKKEEK